MTIDHTAISFLVFLIMVSLSSAFVPSRISATGTIRLTRESLNRHGSSVQFLIPTSLMNTDIPDSLSLLTNPLATLPSNIAALSANPINEAIQSSLSDNTYLFMLPLSTLIATSCQLSGIGGAALFGPTFLLIFPLLNLSLPSPGASVASALLTEVFGFASGLLGYSRRGLVDWDAAGRFIIISVPSAFLGAKGVSVLAGADANPVWLRSAYAILMLGLCAFLTLTPKPEAIYEEEECEVPDGNDDGSEDEVRSKTTADGKRTYTYLRPKLSPSSLTATVGGGSLTGLLGVGIGEVILPQLVRVSCMPVPLAAGTSVAIVVVTALTAACVQFLSLAESVSGEGV